MARDSKYQFRMNTQERLRLGKAANQRGITIAEMLRLLVQMYC